MAAAAEQAGRSSSTIGGGGPRTAPSMSYVTCRFGKLFAMRWTATPTLADTEQLVVDARAAREAAGSQLHLLAVIPIRDVDMPSAEVRARMQALLAQLLESFLAIDVVFEGSGVKASLIRTLLRGMALVSRQTSFEYHYHSNIEAALARMEPKLAFDAVRTLKTLRVSKIVLG